ncbi:PREDICTED: uncharacterized protein LOC109146933 [Ipomoea nil]|uniref:uncharacterized protein LOC109146933 n=1 Tax=Ipomoea nil TaxID=35883 RepID=UPI0009009A28|nr:PREDICTED: uncharacterized protein LOC109146933 [Ipomoea nil]
MASQGLVKMGCRRRIGGGRTTQVWAHPWLPNSQDPFVSTDQLAINQGMMVADLVDDVTGTWNTNLIQQIFNARDASLINKLPLNDTYDDLWYWEGDITGNYSVRSGYRRLGDVLAPNSYVWSSIWKLKIPPNRKNFMWRALSNILPTLDNLIKKRVELVNVCPACGLVEENVMHVLCSCTYASLVWNLLQLPIPPFNGNSFLFWAELWLGDASTLGCDVRGRICGVLHGIWSARNSVVWNGNLPTPTALCNRLSSSWVAWQEYGARPKVPQAHLNTSFVHEGQRQNGVRCYVDAAFHNSHQNATYGFLVMEADGSYVAAANGPMECPYDPLMAEAMAVTEALSWLKNNGYAAASLFTDCAVLVTSLSNTRSFRSYIGFVLDACIRLISTMPGTIVTFVRRDANKAAHMLAKHENAPAVCSVWRDGPPSF